MNTPALIINDEVKITGRIGSTKEISDLILDNL